MASYGSEQLHPLLAFDPPLRFVLNNMPSSLLDAPVEFVVVSRVSCRGNRSELVLVVGHRSTCVQVDLN
jgi:hypothetical protein